jgi:hypothetical protein
MAYDRWSAAKMVNLLGKRSGLGQVLGSVLF